LRPGEKKKGRSRKLLFAGFRQRLPGGEESHREGEKRREGSGGREYLTERERRELETLILRSGASPIASSLPA
jgi:hypothetical protein